MQRFRSCWNVIVPSIAGFVMGGCPTTGTDLAATLATDNTVGRPSVETQAPPAADPEADSFNARLATEFPTCDEPLDVEDSRSRILELVNQERIRNGLSPVVLNETLQDQATQYACEMISFEFFAHVNPVTRSTLSVRSEEFGYDFQVVGENLAAGQRTPEEAFADWMASPSHRQNILDGRFTELGVGVRTGGEFGVYWVQEFGLPAKP